MTPAFLVSAILIGPYQPDVLNSLRDEFRVVMLETTERAKPRPAKAVPKLVALYTKIDGADSLTRSEKGRMRDALKTRLGTQLETLLRENRKRELAGGGAIPETAQQLISLIMTTIAPASWRQNGGSGSISYYPRNPALIIRNTNAVHEEAEALLRALRTN